jgi:hypothetical protein
MPSAHPWRRLRPAALVIASALGCAGATALAAAPPAPSASAATFASAAPAAPPGPRAGAALLVVPTQHDARDTPGPLDVVEASLEQRDVRMSLRITTAGTWRAADLVRTPGRALCVTLAYGRPEVPHARLCVALRGDHPVLSDATLAADGTVVATRLLASVLSRPRSTVLQASFLPVAAGLSVGPYGWWVDSTWTDPAACPVACGDRLPDAGAVDGTLGLVGFVPCFGAAARGGERGCENPALRLAIEPPPEHPDAILDPFCDNARNPTLALCEFGAPAADAAGTFALIGDSHASSMKTALEVVGLGRRWRGVSIVRAACPPTQAAKPILPTRARGRQCVRWNRRVLDWLAGRRDVHTVFLAAHATTEVGRAGDQSPTETRLAGYRDEIRALLRSVKRVVVLRDLPPSAPGHLSCVARAQQAGRAPGPACARPRREALEPDALAQAARALRSPRVTVVDLTSHVCDARRCFPVVGGALVHRDETHLTPAFSATLGPYILRAVDAGAGALRAAP